MSPFRVPGRSQLELTAAGLTRHDVRATYSDSQGGEEVGQRTEQLSGRTEVRLHGCRR
jgi:hypothetical protein